MESMIWRFDIMHPPLIFVCVCSAGGDLRVHTLSEEMSEYKTSLVRAATGRKKYHFLR